MKFYKCRSHNFIVHSSACWFCERGCRRLCISSSNGKTTTKSSAIMIKLVYVALDQAYIPSRTRVCRNKQLCAENKTDLCAPLCRFTLWIIKRVKSEESENAKIPTCTIGNFGAYCGLDALPQNLCSQIFRQSHYEVSRVLINLCTNQLWHCVRFVLSHF